MGQFSVYESFLQLKVPTINVMCSCLKENLGLEGYFIFSSRSLPKIVVQMFVLFKNKRITTGNLVLSAYATTASNWSYWLYCSFTYWNFSLIFIPGTCLPYILILSHPCCNINSAQPFFVRSMISRHWLGQMDKIACFEKNK